jgi:hypothetical protein
MNASKGRAAITARPEASPWGNAAYFFMLSLLPAAGEPSLDISFFGSPLFMPVVLFMEPLSLHHSTWER